MHFHFDGDHRLLGVQPWLSPVAPLDCVHTSSLSLRARVVCPWTLHLGRSLHVTSVLPLQPLFSLLSIYFDRVHFPCSELSRVLTCAIPSPYLSIPQNAKLSCGAGSEECGSSRGRYSVAAPIPSFLFFSCILRSLRAIRATDDMVGLRFVHPSLLPPV